MYAPKYTITNNILKNVSMVDACKEVIENAPIVPAYEKKFREEALIRTVHHGTHIEGNDLSLEQAGKILVAAAGGETNAVQAAEKSGVTARERDIQEVINYRNVMDYIDGVFEKADEEEGGGFSYSEAQIKRIHKLTVHRLIPEENQGVYRKTQVILRDSRTGEVTFRPPPAVEVPYLMEDFVQWANNRESKEAHPVIRAGVAHYSLAAVHPFVDGNGRAARAFATLVLFVEGYDIKKLFSLEEYFDRDAEKYYRTLINTSNQSGDLSDRDLTEWIEYFTSGLAIELARVKDRVRKLSVDTKIRLKRGQKVLLSERQIKIVEYVSENMRARMGELKELFPMVSDDTVLRELQALCESGIIKKHGRTKGAYYELAT
ncbi:MAG: Fic family protein [Candidatus Blackburnbacteria bacterium]|nr:Fic family protein [Candidatus Blackburnbacteria bacterium]